MDFENLSEQKEMKFGKLDDLANQEKGFVIEGIYTKSTEKPGKYGPMITYFVESEEITYGINANGALKKHMPKASIGDFLKITYNGKNDQGWIRATIQRAKNSQGDA